MKKTPKRLEIEGRRSFFRYLPVSSEAQNWGTFVVNAGYTLVAPGSPYPPYRHPQGHHFTWREGRVLSHFTFVYITRGRGEFESEASGLVSLTAGDIFILFPHQWHRYRPDPATGWDEYWIECDGAHLQHILQMRPFSPKQPVRHIGHDEDLLHLFVDVVDILRREPPDYLLLLGAYAELLIAQLFSAQKRQMFEGRAAAEIVSEATKLLAHETGRRQHLQELAAQLNLSYANFRRLFKNYTGFSPKQYALHLCLQRAAQQLAQTRLPISRVAETVGFDSIFYFSRYFKEKMGMSPLAYRRRHQPRAARRA